jgi:hypothetical protein
MLAAHLALVIAALFTGAAVYINWAEQPELGRTTGSLAFGRPRAAYRMEACIQERICDAGPISNFRMPARPDRLVAERSMALDHRSPSDDRHLALEHLSDDADKQ